MADLYKGQPMMARGGGRKDFTTYAFGAQFVEVRVHARTGEVRAPRIVSAFAAGNIINPLTAYSQLMGGAIWGLSSALHEATELDLAHARYINDNLADYMVPGERRRALGGDHHGSRARRGGEPAGREGHRRDRHRGHERRRRQRGVPRHRRAHPRPTDPDRKASSSLIVRNRTKSVGLLKDAHFLPGSAAPSRSFHEPVPR